MYPHPEFDCTRVIPLGQSPQKIASPGKLSPRQFPPRTITLQDNCLAIAPGTIYQENSHLGLRSCPWIITHQQLLPRAMTITNYNFFKAIS